jgi:hypothetical protein
MVQSVESGAKRGRNATCKRGFQQGFPQELWKALHEREGRLT